MVCQVVWSPEASRDVEEIQAYIRRDSEFYARIVAKKIIGVGRKIASFPKAGRIVPELNDDRFRERSVYSYRIIYRLDQDIATVVAVIHGKRLLGYLSERFEE